MRQRSAIAVALLLVGGLLSGCTSATGSPTPTPNPPTPTCNPSPEFPISAYDLWLQDGNEGTVKDFLASLVGEKGEDGYVGYSGEPDAGPAGASAYQLWLEAGNVGSTTDFLESLTGDQGVAGLDGLSAYELWLELGNSGSEQDFLDSLQGICTVGETGERGPQGIQGEQGIQGPAGADGPVGPTGPAFEPAEASYQMGGGTTGDGATQPTFSGNPMFYGTYVEMGPLVYFNVKVVMTNITSFGTGQYFVTLPFASKNPISTSNGRVTDFSSGRNYSLHGSAQGGSDVLLLTYSSGSQQLAFDHNSPINLATTDTFFISGSYIKQ